MKQVELVNYQHSFKVGDKAPTLIANITEDTLFLEDGKPVGFYLSSIPEQMEKIANFADMEFNTKNVPKTVMVRGIKYIDGVRTEGVNQKSAILGAIPPKPHMRRPYPTNSSVHNSKTAVKFIKAMRLLAHHSEQLIKQYMPEVYEEQKMLIETKVPKSFRFSNLFTSSISNYNISADFHRDTGNLKQCVNAIIFKKANANGGNLVVPEHELVVDGKNNSMLVYPAWKSLHAVTPIEPTKKDGYRNSLIFYPLAAFEKYV